MKNDVEQILNMLEGRPIEDAMRVCSAVVATLLREEADQLKIWGMFVTSVSVILAEDEES